MASKDHPALQNRAAQPPCSVCGQVDDHPRHIAIRSVQTFTDPAEAARHDKAYNTADHHDCCNCGGVCQIVLGHAGDKRGHALAVHKADHGPALQKLMDAHHLNGQTAPVVEV